MRSALIREIFVLVMNFLSVVVYAIQSCFAVTFTIVYCVVECKFVCCFLNKNGSLCLPGKKERQRKSLHINLRQRHFALLFHDPFTQFLRILSQDTSCWFLCVYPSTSTLLSKKNLPVSPVMYYKTALTSQILVAFSSSLLIEASHRGFSSRCIWEIVLYALDSSDYADSSSVQRSASCQICLPLDHTDWDECLLVFLTKGSCKESSCSKRGWNEWKKPCDATSKEEEMQSNMNQWKLSRSRSSFCQFARQGILPSIRHSTALDRRRVSDWNQHNNMNTGFWTSLWV